MGRNAEVGSAQIPVFPTFKGFRKGVDGEVDAATKSAQGSVLARVPLGGFESGKTFAAGFKGSGSIDSIVKQASAAVARSSREVSTARLREQDAAGRVRVEEARLSAARARYGSDTAQVIRAEENLASKQRSLASTQDNLRGATERLAAAKRDLGAASAVAAVSGSRLNGTFAQLPTTFGAAGGGSARRFSSVFLDVLGGALGANILTGIGYTIGRGIGNAARTALGYALGAVGLASDLEQSVGAVTSVFKDQAEAVLTASKTSSTSVGLSQRLYQQMATVVGAQLKNLGIQQDAIAGKTDNLISLGADLAAQFGGSTSDAVAAISSLLRGERDPIERYGVSLKQVDIDARKTALGLSDLTGEADKQATILATLQLLTEQTADAQGTFGRETDTLAHKQQVLAAKLEDTQARLGARLLPTAVDLATFADDELLPILEGALDQAGPALRESLRSAMPGIKQDLAEIGENLPALINLGATLSTAVTESLSGDLGPKGPFGGASEFGDTLGELTSERFADSFFLGLIGDSRGAYADSVWQRLFFGAETAAEMQAEKVAGHFAAGLSTADNIDRTNQAARDLVKDYPTIGAEGIHALAEAIRLGSPEAAAAALGIKIGIDGELKQIPGISYATGADAIAGFVNGIHDNLFQVAKAGLAIAEEAKRSVKAGINSNSPSRDFYEIADEGAIAGWVLGVKENLHKVAASGDLIAQASKPGLDASGVAGSGGVSTGLGGLQYLQPVYVTPEQDVRIVGRQLGREFMRETLGALMTTITLGGIVFDDRGAPGWNFTKLKDWRGVPESKQVKPSRPPGQDGTFRSFDTSREGVVPTFDVVYVGQSEAEALEAWDHLAAIVSPVNEVSMVVADALHTTSRMVTVRSASPDDHRGMPNIAGTIDCHSADPFRYGADHVVSTGLPVAGGGYRWNARWPARWGTGGVPGRAIQQNVGKQPTSKILLAVSGGLEAGFSAVSIEDGREIRLERVIPAGQTAYVDFLTGRAYLDAPANDITTFLTRFSPWSVPAGGTRTIQFNSLGGSSGTPMLTATTSPPYL